MGLWVCWKFLACYGVSKIQYQNTIGIHKSKQSDEQVHASCHFLSCPGPLLCRFQVWVFFEKNPWGLTAGNKLWSGVMPSKMHNFDGQAHFMVTFRSVHRELKMILILLILFNSISINIESCLGLTIGSWSKRFDAKATAPSISSSSSWIRAGNLPSGLKRIIYRMRDPYIP